jgi:hypothetical protein
MSVFIEISFVVVVVVVVCKNKVKYNHDYKV